MPDESDDESLLAELRRIFFQNFDILTDMLFNLPPALQFEFGSRIRALKDRSDAAVQTMNTLPVNERSKWMLANLEQTNEEMGQLIREMRQNIE